MKFHELQILMIPVVVIICLISTSLFFRNLSELRFWTVFAITILYCCIISGLSTLIAYKLGDDKKHYIIQDLSELNEEVKG